jgi:putative ABC transport system substrate-binding protein
MRRREFITLIAAAVTAPSTVRSNAEQASKPVLGFLSTRTPEDSTHEVAAFLSALAQNGYVEGKNVAIEYRWGRGQYDRLPAMATELARRPVSLLVATGGEPAARAAKDATSTIPIVYLVGGDPVKQGLAASFNRPGGNATGMTLLTGLMESKRFGLLRELIPNAATVGVLVNPKISTAEDALRDVQRAANSLGVQVQFLQASSDDEIELAFETASKQHLAALVIAADPFFDTRREKIVALAARHAVPAMYQFRDYVAIGGLISYGVDLPDAYRQAGLYAGQILKGANPADLPIMQPTKFLLVINSKTAKALGLKISDDLLSLADEVIE